MMDFVCGEHRSLPTIDYNSWNPNKNRCANTNI